MANPKKRVPENVPGDYFVDSTCIDCDTCRQIAPQVFGEAAETAFVWVSLGCATIDAWLSRRSFPVRPARSAAWAATIPSR